MDMISCSCSEFAEICRRKKSCCGSLYNTSAVRCRAEKTKKKRTLWARQWLLRRLHDEGVLSMLFNELGPEDPKSFLNYTRMQEAVMGELLGLITPLIEKRDTVMRQCIPARHRLAATLRFLASGNTYVDLSYATRIAPNTLSVIIPETLKAIVTVLEGLVMRCPSTPEEWEAEAGNFHALWQFPHCIGALDGKHIAFRPSKKTGSLFRNYKQFNSIILLALVNAKYEFLYADIGCNGRMHDAGVFWMSSLYAHLDSRKLNLPAPHPLPGDTVPMPYVIVADDAFPLRKNIMKPYPGHAAYDKKIHNYRLSRACRVVENAFGILSNRFRILLSTIPLSVEKVELITHACVLLHNYLLQRSAEQYIPPNYKDGEGASSLRGVRRQGGNRCSNNASRIRDRFCLYFNGVGAVPWQDEAVAKGNY